MGVEKLSKRSVLVLFAAILCFLLVTSVQAENPLLWNNITAKPGPGFGDQWNKYAWSMADWNGYLYVGTNNVNFDLLGAVQDQDFLACAEQTFNAANPFGIFTCFATYGYQSSRGAAIWRYSYQTRQWEQVYGTAIDPSQVSGGFRKMMVYDGKLYASSSNHLGLAVLLVTEDGENWQTIDNPTGMGPAWSFRALEVYNGSLYVGTDDNTGAEIWRYSTEIPDNGGSTWLLVHKFDSNVTGVGELAVYYEMLYAGVADLLYGWGLYEVLDVEQPSGDAVIDVTPWNVDGVNLQLLHNIGVSKLYVFNNELYLGTANYIEGFTFLRCSYERAAEEEIPAQPVGEWDIITINGFDNDRNTYVWSMVEYMDVLLMGTFTSDFLEVFSFLDGINSTDVYSVSPTQLLQPGSAQLWATRNGRGWKQLDVPRFGFGIWTYGFRNMVTGGECPAVENGGPALFIGTATNLFAPDANDLYAFFYELSLSTEIAFLLDYYFAPEWVDDDLLQRFMGPGCEIWEVVPRLL